MNFLAKLAFLFKKPKVIIVTGEGRQTAKEAIFQVLKQYFKFGREILIFETDLTKSPDIGKFKFLASKSSLPILIVTHIGDIPVEQDFFAGDRVKTLRIRELAKTLPSWGHLILNFDDETAREIKDETNLKESTFGFQERADFRATDIKYQASEGSEGGKEGKAIFDLNRGTNFKINYKGNIVPVWLEELFGKEQIYSALSAAAVGTIFGLNLVKISQSLKEYKSLPGKMKLIEGIKHSWILDDSESATIFSMVEALEILGKIQGFKRKIAVLGDVIGIGKYTIEAHEAIGERVARAADSLFTFGQRAKFIAQGASVKGMTQDRIFQFDKIEDGKILLQNEIKEGDLILVDGSKEMKMGKIIEEIKART